MAAGIQSAPLTTRTPAAGTRYLLPMALMVALFFSIGFITSLNDILVPHFRDLFHLSNVRALLVQFCFFGAYFVMSLPAGWIVGRIGYKAGIIAALGTMACGLLLFVPASIVIAYPLFLCALFVVGSGLALLQVAINPYVGALGPPETAASRITVCGFLNSLATTLAPYLGATFIFIAPGATTQQLASSVRLPYVYLALFAILLAVVTRFVPLPDVLETPIVSKEVSSRPESSRSEDSVERPAASSLFPLLSSTPSALSFTHLRLGALAIFLYVGAEVAIGSVLINYLGQPAMGGLSHAAAARYVVFYWGGAMVGRFFGSFLLTVVRAHRALAAVSAAAMLLVAITLFGHGHAAGLAIVACGLFNSVMWPCIFPLALKGLGPRTNQGSGILVTMIVGGALVPLAQGKLADLFGFQHSFALILLCYAYLLYFGLSGHRPRQPLLA